MVTFRLMEKNDETITYRYFPTRSYILFRFQLILL